MWLLSYIYHLFLLHYSFQTLSKEPGLKSPEEEEKKGKKGSWPRETKENCELEELAHVDRAVENLLLCKVWDVHGPRDSMEAKRG